MKFLCSGSDITITKRVSLYSFTRSFYNSWYITRHTAVLLYYDTGADVSPSMGLISADSPLRALGSRTLIATIRIVVVILIHRLLL